MEFDKYLFILGSGFNKKHEYELPKLIDPVSNWQVFYIHFLFLPSLIGF